MQRPLQFLGAAPRAYLFARSVPIAMRPISSSSRMYQQPSSSSPFGVFGAGPAPPRLPKEEQDIFEALQQQSTGAFSTPRSPPKINQSPDSSAADTAEAEAIISERTEMLSDETASKSKQDFVKIIEARGEGEELHPNVRRGATPEFEGDINPKTGEVGGPKNEPLRWGSAGEWSYNGRTTDF